MLPLPSPESILHGAAIFFRAGAFLFLLPLVGRPVPASLRAALGAFLAFIAVPLSTPAAGLTIPHHWTGFALLAGREAFIGFMMGYAVLAIFYLCQIAGQFISVQIGLMQSNIFNPMMSEQETAIGTAMSMLAVALLFALNIHHLIIFAFLRSLQIAPPGTLGFSAGSAETVVSGIGKIFLIATQMSAPIIAVNYIVTLAFAILGKAVPSMNILILSFGVRIWVGIFVLIMVFVVVAQFLLGVIQDTPERMLQFLPIR